MDDTEWFKTVVSELKLGLDKLGNGLEDIRKELRTNHLEFLERNQEVAILKADCSNCRDNRSKETDVIMRKLRELEQNIKEKEKEAKQKPIRYREWIAFGLSSIVALYVIFDKLGVLN